MTADLVARLEKAAAHPLLHESDARLFREAASTLRSSGEAVAWPDRMVNMPCPDGSTDRILGFRIPEGDPILGESGLSEPLAWLRSVTIDRCPATPASAWRPIAEAPADFRDGTFIVTNRLGEVAPMVRGVIQNNVGSRDWTFGEPITEWQPLPPTGTKGG